jgi:hypothetical protein
MDARCLTTRRRRTVPRPHILSASLCSVTQAPWSRSKYARRKRKKKSKKKKKPATYNNNLNAHFVVVVVMDEQIPGPAGKGVANCKGRGMYVLYLSCQLTAVVMGTQSMSKMMGMRDHKYTHPPSTSALHLQTHKAQAHGKQFLRARLRSSPSPPPPLSLGITKRCKRIGGSRESCVFGRMIGGCFRLEISTQPKDSLNNPSLPKL